MSREYFDMIGRDMLESFVKYWPLDEAELYVYSEDTLPFEHPSVIIKPLAAIPGVQDFLRFTEAAPGLQGIGIKADGTTFRDYRLDANAFSRKVFAMCDAAQGHRGYLYWVDADVLTQRHIPAAFLERCIDGYFLACMLREGWHVCTSFVAFDCVHPMAESFFLAYREAYLSGRVFWLKGWTDCHVLEHILPALGDAVKNLGADFKREEGDPPFYNVFDKLFVGYATHAKGNKKKAHRGRYNRLREIVEMLKPKTVMEFGTWNGDRAIELCKAAGTTRYVGFDLFERATDETDASEMNVKRHYAQLEVKEKLKAAGLECVLIGGDTRETAQEAVNLGIKADFVYIDGGHSVETIQSDFEASLKMMGHGLIVLDDYYVDMPEEMLAKFGAQAVLKDIPHKVFPEKDPVKGGGFTQLAVVMVHDHKPVAA